MTPGCRVAPRSRFCSPGCGCSPIDLLPEFLPVIGPLDDVLVAALALRYAARYMPRSVLLDAWPADPRLLERLLGPPVTPTQAA